MVSTMASAMRLLESAQLEQAAEAFAPLVAPTPAGAIARFRRAECLSRLGRHDEAVAEATRAARESPGESPPALWLAQTLAEAGRFEDAAAVEIPATSVESLAGLAQGYAALARLAAADHEDATATADAILSTRHAPLYSLALRLAEEQRLAGEPRWPDLPSVWYGLECAMERDDVGLAAHEETPVLGERMRPPRGRDLPGASFGGQLIANAAAALPRTWTPQRATGWVRMHAGCGDFTALIAALRAASEPTAALEEAELEVLMALGRLDEAHELAEQLADDAGDEAAGELCIDRARIAQMAGRAARPAEFAGFDDAEKRLVPTVTWLDMTAALMDGRPLDARTLADAIADPAHREYVEAALRRWATAPQRG